MSRSVKSDSDFDRAALIHPWINSIDTCDCASTAACHDHLYIDLLATRDTEVDRKVGLGIVARTRINTACAQKVTATGGIDPNFGSGASVSSLFVKNADLERVPGELRPQKVLEQTVGTVLGCSGEREIEVSVHVEVDPCRSVTGVSLEDLRRGDV